MSMYYMLKGDAGAVGDGIHDDTTAIRNWFAHGLATGQALGTEPGRFKVTSPICFDYNSGVGANGVTMLGSGKQQTIFDASSVSTGIPFQFYMGGGSVANPAVSLYSKIVDIGFLANYNGPAVQLGKSDYSDNLGVLEFDAWIANPNQGASVQALNTYFIIQSLFKNVVANCGRSTAGTALAVFRGEFNTFTNCSFGNAAIACYMHEDSWGNVFASQDFDDCGTCLVIDDARVKNNKFVGGQWAYFGNGVSATAGSGNRIECAHQAPFPGAGAFVSSSVGLTVI